MAAAIQRAVGWHVSVLLPQLLLLLLLPASHLAQGATVKSRQCAWDSLAQSCDVHPLFIAAAVTRPKRNDALAASLVKSVGADAACSLFTSEAKCNARSKTVHCAWSDFSVPSCRLTSGKLLMDAAAAAACPGTMAVKQLPCAKEEKKAACKAVENGKCRWLPPTREEKEADPDAIGACVHKSIAVKSKDERDEALFQFREYEAEAWGTCPLAQAYVKIAKAINSEPLLEAISKHKVAGAIRHCHRNPGVAACQTAEGRVVLSDKIIRAMRAGNFSKLPRKAKPDFESKYVVAAPEPVFVPQAQPAAAAAAAVPAAGAAPVVLPVNPALPITPPLADAAVTPPAGGYAASQGGDTLLASPAFYLGIVATYITGVVLYHQLRQRPPAFFVNRGFMKGR